MFLCIWKWYAAIENSNSAVKSPMTVRGDILFNFDIVKLSLSGKLRILKNKFEFQNSKDRHLINAVRF